MAEVVQHTLKFSGKQTYFHRAGDRRGPGVLLLHGGGPGADAWSNWQRLLPRLNGYDVLAPDLIGFGRSTHPDPPLSDLAAWMKLRIEQVITLLDRLKIDRTAVVGNSMGGALSLFLALRHPERIGPVALMGSAGTPAPVTPELENMLGYYRDPSIENMSRLIGDFLYDPSVFGDELTVMTARRHEQASVPEIRRSFEAMFASYKERPPTMFQPADLERLHGPVLLAHGREDRLVPMEASLYLLEHIPRAELHVYPRCGHWLQLEYPQEFEALLRQFLARGGW